MTDAPFRPFETLLDEGVALSILRQATAGADDGELFLERKRSEGIVLDDGRIKTAAYDASEGFGLRAVRGEVAGYAHSTEISEKSLRRASETARIAVGDGGGTLAASLISGGHAAEIIAFSAGRVFGSNCTPAVGPMDGAPTLYEAEYVLSHVQVTGDDVLHIWRLRGGPH